jgi:hypothetical protein
MARGTYEASRCVDQTCRGEPAATKSREPTFALVITSARVGPKKTQGAIRGETWGRRVRNRRSKGRSKSSASSVDRRRLGPGKATPCHDGGVEAVLAALAESVNHYAHRDTSAHRYRVRVATGVSEARSRRRVGGRKRPHHSCAIRRSDAERRETLSSSARWAATHRDHARRRVGDAGPGKRQGTGARSSSCGKQRFDRTHL